MPECADIREGLQGCGNHPCIIHKHTDGPCHCVPNIVARRLIVLADHEIARLSALLHERERELCDARADAEYWEAIARAAGVTTEEIEIGRGVSGHA